MKTSAKIFVPLLLATLTLGGCGWLTDPDDGVLPDRRADYKKARAEDRLELPPDLSSGAITDSMPIPAAPAGSALSPQDAGTSSASRSEAGVLTENAKIRVQRDGDRRWLVVQGEPEQVWKRVREFWLDSGFLLKVEDPRIGILETEWAENRADIPSDPIREALKSSLDFLYSAGTRDKYRVRLERGGQPGTTEVFLTHYGMEEVVRRDSVGEVATTIWKPRDADPELEAEMLNRMLVFLGVEDAKARSQIAKEQTRPDRARMVRGEGQSVLLLDESFDRAWRLTGVALDQIGFVVDDRNRADGLYYVRYKDPFKDTKQEEGGFFSKLKFWGDDDKPSESTAYQVKLQGEGPTTNISVLDDVGKPEKSSTGERILTLLYEQLK
ncbi:MAG: outer membrane protein assembly factor BamC [Chromatiales bacterium]|nr:outer membrane protein assembly factor BamC [Chromatiales bacterium]